MTGEETPKASDEMFCSSCGEIIKAAAEICPKCGVRQNHHNEMREGIKSPGIAAIASFIIVGAGQLYNGQIAKGILFHIGMWFAVIFGVLFFWLILPLFIPLLFWVYNIYDAHNQAEKINRGEIAI